MASLKNTKAWKLFSQFIRLRDGGVCFTCDDRKSWKLQHAGHYIHRNKSTFFDEMNVNCHCVVCNTWNHGKRGEYAVKLIDKYGRKKFNDLVKRSIQTKNWSPKELKEIERLYISKIYLMKELQLDDEPIKEKKRKVCIHKMVSYYCSMCMPRKKIDKKKKEE